MKYHDNTTGIQYGPDGYLTDNWNPDPVYPENEYIQVYFRIDCKYYGLAEGCPWLSFESEEGEKAFNAEKEAVFRSLGWTVKEPDHNGSCMVVENGKQSLYLHPQNFSGYVSKNSVRKIAEALENRETFTCEWIDLYRDAVDMTYEEYRKVLEEQKEDIKRQLYSKCNTGTKKRWFSRLNIVEHIAGGIYPRRLRENLYEYDNVVIEFVDGIVSEMENEGYFRIEGDVMALRTKRELKSLKLPLCA